MKNKVILSFLLFAFVLLSCTKNGNVQIHNLSNVTTLNSNEEAFQGFQLSKDTSFRLSDEVILTRIRDIDFDSFNRIYIVDNLIHVYDSNGTYFRSIGTVGNGVGEFRSIGNIEIYSDSLFVYDVYHNRLSIFDVDSFELLDDFIISPPTGMISRGEFHIGDAGEIIFGFEDSGRPDINRYIHYVTYNNTYTFKEYNKIFEMEIEKIFEIGNNGRGISGTVPFSRKTLIDISINNMFYVVWTDQFLVKQYSIEGQYQQSFYHPYDNVQVDLNSLGSSRSVKTIVENIDIPSTQPAVSSFFVDDQKRIWVSTIKDDPDIYGWWVINQEGNILARFNWPRSSNILISRMNYVYALDTDDAINPPKLYRYMQNE